MPGYGSRGYQGRGQPSGGDIGRGSQTNNQTGNNSQSGQSTRSQAPPGRDPGGSHTGGVNLGYQSSGGSDDYGIGSGGEFGGTVTQDVKDAYVPWQSSTSNLPDNYTYTGDYVPYSTPWQENLAGAIGGLSYDWVDPDSDFFKDEEGNIIGKPGE